MDDTPEIKFATTGKNHWIRCSDGEYLLNWLEINMERSDSDYIPLGHGASKGWCVYKDSTGTLWRVTFTNKRIDRDANVKPRRYCAQRVKRVETPIIHVDYLGV